MQPNQSTTETEAGRTAALVATGDLLGTSEIRRKLEHARRRLAEKRMEQEASGGPASLTYHGGWSLGYLEGKVAALEDVLNA
jgi:hypothetical protein